MLPYQIPPVYVEFSTSPSRRPTIRGSAVASAAKLSRKALLVATSASDRIGRFSPNLNGHSGWFENCYVALKEIRLPFPVGSRELAFQFGDDLGSSRFVQYLTMPAFKTFNAEQPLALQCPREHDRGTMLDPRVQPFQKAAIRSGMLCPLTSNACQPNASQRAL